jgi:hypothetical protein
MTSGIHHWNGCMTLDRPKSRLLSRPSRVGQRKRISQALASQKKRR